MKLVLIDNMIALRLNRPVIIYNCSRPIPAATESVMKGKYSNIKEMEYS